MPSSPRQLPPFSLYAVWQEYMLLQVLHLTKIPSAFKTVQTITLMNYILSVNFSGKGIQCAINGKVQERSSKCPHCASLRIWHMTVNSENHLGMPVTCMAAACAVKVQGLNEADGIEPCWKPSHYLLPVPLDGSRWLTYFGMLLSRMVKLLQMLTTNHSSQML